MMLWMFLTVMVAVTAVGLAIPLVRRYDARPPRGGVVGVLKAQLADIEGQAASGTLGAEEAAGLATEVKRRLLTEGREAEPSGRPLGGRALMLLAFGLVAVVALAATGLYAKLGRPDVASPSAPTSGAAGATHPGGGDIAAVIAQLEARLKQSPDDAAGWGVLGWSYFQTTRYAEAASAYGRAAELDPGNSEHQSARGESLVRAADGQVTPSALEAFRKAASIDPGDPRARYFLAVAKDQGGDQAGAMDDWIALLRTAPEGAPWALEVRAFVEKVARSRGEDISARLPPVGAAAAGGSAAPGPDAAQVAAAQGLPDAERQRMIAGMVDGLAARLKADPNDSEGWVRLMRARMVLGQTGQAAAAYRDARSAFAASPAEQARLRGAAKELGVPGA